MLFTLPRTLLIPLATTVPINPPIQPLACRHLASLHAVLLGGNGSGPALGDFADSLLLRFGSASGSELHFFRQQVMPQQVA